MSDLGIVRRARRSPLILLAAAIASLSLGPLRAAPPLPERLTDAEFWTLESDSSEPGGFFRIADNFTSNEMEIGQVVTMLRDAHVRGGVYIGVGPEQNFSYIAAIHPEMAFIVDIRRQAAMQHLMFKAIFELAKDRADFISLLFSRPRPDGLDATTPIKGMWAAFRAVPVDENAAAANAARILNQLKTHGFALTAQESELITSVLAAFVRYGPDITTQGARGFGGGGVSFSDLTAWSTDANGTVQSFLSTEDDFRSVQTLQTRNLVVPVTGDFGGPKAIRAIGAYLQTHGAAVSGFYVSNVEQYLFQDGKDRAFYDNLATLPIADTAVFIRPYSLRPMRPYGRMGQALCPMGGFLTAVRAGLVLSNNDSLACGR